MKYVFLSLILVFTSIHLTSQCYDVGVKDLMFNPDPASPVEQNGTTTMTFSFCNNFDEIPSDPNGNTSITICTVNLLSEVEPTGTYASNFSWTYLFDCWIGTIPQDSITPTGCGTIVIDYAITENSPEDMPTNCVNVNVQPAGIISGNSCFDVKDDVVDGCTYTVTNQDYSIISGSINNDENCDQEIGANELPAPYYPLINTTTGNIVDYTNDSGNFESLIYVPWMDSIDLAPSPYQGYSAYPEYIRVVNDGSAHESLDYLLCPDSEFSNLAVNLASPWPPVPDFHCNYQICVENRGSIVEDAELEFKFSNQNVIEDWVSFIELDGAQLDGLSLTWDLTDFGIFDSRCFNISVLYDEDTPLGTPVAAEATIMSNSNLQDIQPDDNQDKISQTVIASFDPNTKAVSPDTLEFDQISNSNNFSYLIKFQNIGTTAANRVEVIDTISDFFDMNSFQMLTSSHPYSLNLIERNVLQWTFEDIMLAPASENEEASIGFIEFSVNSLAGLSEADKLRNRASIIFDSNAAILTNTSEVFYKEFTSSTQSLNSTAFTVYPNPSSSNLHITLDENITASSMIQLFDIKGKLLLQEKHEMVSGKIQKINVQQMQAGLYILKLKAKEKDYIQKIVIQ